MKVIALALLVIYTASVHARVATSRKQSIGVDECPKEQETNWEIEWLMVHEDCNKFYMCTFGVPVEFRCYGDLFFNLETWQCDWQHNVDCEGRIIPDSIEDGNDVQPSTVAPPAPTTTTTTTTPAPTTTTTTTTPAPTTTTTTTTPAPTTTTTTTTPAPTTTTTTTTPAPTTTTTTTTPAPTTTTTTTTPAPTTTTTTTTPAPTTTTTTTSTTTPAPTTTTTTTTPAPTTTTSTTTQAPSTTAPGTEDDQSIEFQENGCPVNPHIHWLLPHETDCNLFYYCVWGEKVLRNCPGVLHFNTKLQVCDHQVDAGCTLPKRAQFSLGEWFQNLV